MKYAKHSGAIWGILGITLILGLAILRVMPHVFEAINSEMNTMEWVILIAWSILMLLAEGYRGFQKQFSPRVAARLWQLFNDGKLIDLILAPLYCMSYFHATKKRIIISWAITASITLLIAIVRLLPQPWRGIIDFGVVLGLFYGLVSVYIFTIRTFKSNTYPTNANLG